MKLLLDSVILIDHFNGMPAASAYLAANKGEAAISVITRAEVLTGFDAQPAALATQLLDAFPTLPIDTTVADLAAILRRQHGWKLPDALQAALAQHYGLQLVTRNSKDFPPTRFEFVLVPYQL